MRINIEVTRERIHGDPHCDIWRIVVQTDKAEWREAYGSKEIVDAFLRGVAAGASMYKNYDVNIEWKDGIG